MHINKISASNYSINYKGTKNIAKIAIGTISTGIAATLGKNKIEENNTNQDYFYEDLSDIEEIDDNIFDEEYYQAYYNIDLNLANNKAFRDNELFNPLRDKEGYEYRQYDKYDVPHANNLIYKNDIYKYTTIYKLSDTDFGATELPKAVTDANYFQTDDLKILDRYDSLNKKIKQLKIEDYIKDIILDHCKRNTGGFNEVDFDLVNIALNLYENDKKQYCNMEDILNIINILKKCESDSDEYKYHCNYITASILANQPNNKIYKHLYNTIA